MKYLDHGFLLQTVFSIHNKIAKRRHGTCTDIFGDPPWILVWMLVVDSFGQICSYNWTPCSNPTKYLQHKKNLWVHQIQSPACLSLDFINELLDKMHSWFLYVHALYTMVESSWILISRTLWNGLPKHHTHRKSQPLGPEIPHWAPIKNGISIFRLARLTISDACCARVIFKKT